MFDHLLGRPPSPGYRKIQVLAIILFWLWRIVYGNPNGPRLCFVRRANRILRFMSPWQLIVGTLTFIFALRQWDVLLGLSAPEPLAHLYSRSYYRATWIATGLDAGFATAMTIKPKWLRDLSSIIFSIYYILYTSKGEEKLRKFRAVCTVEMLRATWNKTTNPYLRAVTVWDRPSLPVVKKITLNRPHDLASSRPIVAWLFYSRSERELRFASDLILDFPGGGFLSMGPQHHEERLRRWAQQTGRPVLSIDYSKAPEYPYPYAIEECFDAYRLLVASKGQVIGMAGQALNIIMSGDSAGGNICCNVMFKILETPWEHPIPHPIAIVLNYAALDFGFTSWMSPAQLSILRAEHLQSSSHIMGLAEQKDHFSHKSPLAVVSDEGHPGLKRRRSTKRQKSWAESLGFNSHPEKPGNSVDRTSKRTLSKKKSFSIRFQDRNHRTGEDDEEEGNIADSEGAERQDRNDGTDKDKDRKAKLDSGVSSNNLAVLAAKKPFETRLTMTSRVGYFQDKIISPSMMRAMAILYIGPHQNPNFETDYRLSPVLAPNVMLDKFPPVLLMCGEKDPFVDDSVIFAGRLREAKRARKLEIAQARRKKVHLGESLRMTSMPLTRSRGYSEDRLLQESDDDWVTLEVIEGWSHGYLQMTSLMPEAREAVEHLAEWMEEVFVNRDNRSKADANIKLNTVDIDASASSETEIEEPLTFVPKNRRQSSYTKTHDEVNGLRSAVSSDHAMHAKTTSDDTIQVSHSNNTTVIPTSIMTGRTSLLTGVNPLQINGSPILKSPQFGALLTESPAAIEPSTSVGTSGVTGRPLTPGMVNVKETDIMKRRRLDAVLGMEQTETSPSK